jgi:hypothetical protein
MTQTQLQIYLRKIDRKNSWGKNELKMLILDIIAGNIT